MTEEDIKKLQSTGGEHLATAEASIIGNHLEGLWEVVRKIQIKNQSTKNARIDFVLDNAGFEVS
jgi:hypothetical protein